MKKKVSIVVPVFNENKNVPLIIGAIKAATEHLGYDFHITFVDDGSKDRSLSAIKEQAALHGNVYFISFSKNFGHQNAIKAGFDLSTADCVITMDGDLQHPPALIPRMLEKWEAGYDIVFTKRLDNPNLSLLKRKTSTYFYKLLNALSDIEIDSGTADFRLMDARVINVLKQFQEEDLFWRGLVKWVGFNQIGIEYEPHDRIEGSSKYGVKKMIQFAIKGITSFSTKPLYIATYLGFTFSMLSLLYIPYIVISLVWEHPVSGWASVIATIAFFGGMQLMMLGIIGIYLGKLFMQSKHRPHYIVRESHLP